MARLKAVQVHYGAQIGGTKYDVIWIMRAEMAKHAFDSKEPWCMYCQRDLKLVDLA
jgi:hypothetical protein